MLRDEKRRAQIKRGAGKDSGAFIGYILPEELEIHGKLCMIPHRLLTQQKY